MKAAVNRGAAAVINAMRAFPDSDVRPSSACCTSAFCVLLAIRSRADSWAAVVQGLQHWGCAALSNMSHGSEMGRRIVVQEVSLRTPAAVLSLVA